MCLQSCEVLCLVGVTRHGQLLIKAYLDLVTHGDAGEKEAYKNHYHKCTNVVVEQERCVYLFEPNKQKRLLAVLDLGIVQVAAFDTAEHVDSLGLLALGVQGEQCYKAGYLKDEVEDYGQTSVQAERANARHRGH